MNSHNWILRCVVESGLIPFMQTELNLYFHLPKFWLQTYNRLCSEWLNRLKTLIPPVSWCYVLPWMFTTTMLSYNLKSTVWSYRLLLGTSLTRHLTLKSHLGTAKVQQLTTTATEVEPACEEVHVHDPTFAFKLGSTVLLEVPRQR